MGDRWGDARNATVQIVTVTVRKTNTNKILRGMKISKSIIMCNSLNSHSHISINKYNLKKNILWGLQIWKSRTDQKSAKQSKLKVWLVIKRGPKRSIISFWYWKMRCIIWTDVFHKNWNNLETQKNACKLVLRNRGTFSDHWGQF